MVKKGILLFNKNQLYINFSSGTSRTTCKNVAKSIRNGIGYNTKINAELK